MLSRFAHVSRCLRPAHRPPRPYPIAVTWSYSSEAGLSAVTTGQPPPTTWAPKFQVPEVTQLDFVASGGTNTLPSATLASTTLTIYKRRFKRRLYQGGRPGNRQPSTKVKQRCVGRHESNRLRYVGKDRPRAVTEIPSTSLVRRRRSQLQRYAFQRRGPLDFGSINRQASARSSPKYLKSPRWVSLGSWAPHPEAQMNGTERQENEREIDVLDSSWSQKLMRLEQGCRPGIWRTRNLRRFEGKYAALLHQFWLHLPKHERINRWRDAMLWCLQHSPTRGLAMLLAIFKGRLFRPPRYMVQDSLQFLARHYLFDVSKPDPAAKKAIWQLTFKFIDREPSEEPRSYAMSQEVVQLLLKHCNDDQVSSLYEKLVANEAELHVNTMLHFLAKFVNMGRLYTSMGVLARVASSSVATSSNFDAGVDLSQVQIQAACVKLLRSQWGLERPYSIQSKLLTQMLELGIRPNTGMYNAILLNMIEGHDFETAWQTFDIARQSSHFATDEITYGILAKGAKLSGEFNILEKVLRDTGENRSMLFQNPCLMTSILDAISHFSPGEEFSAMLEYYKRYLDLRPLQELGLCSLEIQASHDADVNEKWPDKHILGQMILAYNKNHALSDDLIQKYDSYHRFVQQQHPLIASLAQNDYVANSFLMAFGKRHETLQQCTTVVKDMLSPHPSIGPIAQATPTVRTWSILLAAYMRHRQSHAAEKVLTMMCARGLRPDIVTWNTIISGYASLQDVESAVGTMRRLEAEGLQSNAKTLKGLGRIRDRATLLKKLEESLESPTSVGPQRSVNPKEVEAMAEGWEADVGRRDWEVRRYLQSFNERYKQI